MWQLDAVGPLFKNFNTNHYHYILLQKQQELFVRMAIVDFFSGMAAAMPGYRARRFPCPWRSLPIGGHLTQRSGMA
ncbi:hypothetical protein [Pseudogulbenkiania sp. MAI-1]|uniref:hypothetical protein n=1 Tax=Pseudogulbenkiania sp. MAI-1 TaxID=990370 RepID=UPI0012EC994A|nr:hypothetical protein [Pseudogulbenkiania sp. MAI-1]